jgi:hypothetical protein
LKKWEHSRPIRTNRRMTRHTVNPWSLRPDLPLAPSCLKLCLLSSGTVASYHHRGLRICSHLKHACVHCILSLKKMLAPKCDASACFLGMGIWTAIN